MRDNLLTIRLDGGEETSGESESWDTSEIGCKTEASDRRLNEGRHLARSRADV